MVILLPRLKYNDIIYTQHPDKEVWFMYGFFYRIQRFMAGRNGVDKLNRFLFVFYIVLSVFSIFIHSLIFYLIQLSFAGLIVFRTLSKNIYRRSKENLLYIKCETAVKNFFIRNKNRIRDRKTHSYIKCKHCKAKLRVKRNKGKHTVRCPKCRQEFSVTIR